MDFTNRAKLSFYPEKEKQKKIDEEFSLQGLKPLGIPLAGERYYGDDESKKKYLNDYDKVLTGLRSSGELGAEEFLSDSQTKEIADQYFKRWDKGIELGDVADEARNVAPTVLSLMGAAGGGLLGAGGGLGFGAPATVPVGAAIGGAAGGAAGEGINKIIADKLDIPPLSDKELANEMIKSGIIGGITGGLNTLGGPAARQMIEQTVPTQALRGLGTKAVGAIEGIPAKLEAASERLRSVNPEFTEAMSSRQQLPPRLRSGLGKLLDKIEPSLPTLSSGIVKKTARAGASGLDYLRAATADIPMRNLALQASGRKLMPDIKSILIPSEKK